MLYVYAVFYTFALCTQACFDGKLCASRFYLKCMQLQEAFGKAVRSVREQKNLTQAQLAERAGIHLSAVSHVERARRQSSFETLIVVASALDTPLSTLMRLAEEMMKIKEEGTTVDLPPGDE